MSKILQEGIALVAYYIGDLAGRNNQDKNWFDAIKVIESVIEFPGTLSSILEFEDKNKHLKLTESERSLFFHNQEVRRVLFLFFIGTYKIKKVGNYGN